MKSVTDTPIIVSLPADLAGQLELLMQATGQDHSAITVAALRDYLAADAEHIADVEQGVAEADRGEFASDDEVAAFFAKYGA